jgi:DNA-directed RNA polymerase specialized sigma24 family protein
VVLQVISEAIRRLDYDPERGSFRSWLFVLVRNQMHKFQAARRAGLQGSGGTTVQELLEQQPTREEGEEALWELEYKRQLVTWAAGAWGVRGEDLAGVPADRGGGPGRG